MFAVHLSVTTPDSFLLVVTKAGGNCCGLSLKITEEEEAAACVAVAKEISVNAAAAAVSSQFDGILASKRNTSISTAGFTCWGRCFCITVNSLCQVFWYKLWCFAANHVVVHHIQCDLSHQQEVLALGKKSDWSSVQHGPSSKGSSKETIITRPPFSQHYLWALYWTFPDWNVRNTCEFLETAHPIYQGAFCTFTLPIE